VRHCVRLNPAEGMNINYTECSRKTGDIMSIKQNVIHADWRHFWIYFWGKQMSTALNS